MKKKTILVLGAGRSSKALISYLLDHAEEECWHVIVGDNSVSSAKEIINGNENAETVLFNIKEEEMDDTVLQRATVVISLLPPSLHVFVAKKCLHYGKHLFTASYTSDTMQAMHKEAQAKGILFMNECGLDPGIDHMSVKKVVDEIEKKGGKVVSLESFAGGLIAPETDVHNPWRYKFTWNPMGIVTAGQSTAKFLEQGEYKYIPCSEIFRRLRHITIPSYGDFVGYANRDSLNYRKIYGLEHAYTIERGTLRMKGFCSAWNVLVRLGCTENTYLVKNADTMTHRSFVNSFLPYDRIKMLEEKLPSAFDIDATGHEMKCLRWMNLFEDEPIGLQKGTPAVLLKHILNKKWQLKKEDKDMVVLWHRFIYELEGVNNEIKSTLVFTREEGSFTAMAKGVGLPLAILTKFFLRGQINLRGVQIPTSEMVYAPLLKELTSFGLKFKDEHRVLE